MILFHYHLAFEVSGTDRQNLPMILEDYRLDLEDHLDDGAVASQIRAGRVQIGLTLSEPLEGFESDIGLLSTYLHQVLRGLEVRELVSDPPDPRQVVATKVLGRLGETHRTPLLVGEDEGRIVVDLDRDDLDELEFQWPGLPLWVQNGLRIKYPRLRRL